MRRFVALLVALVALGAAPSALGSADPLYPRQWGMSMIHSDDAHATTAGDGAVVAVVDSGVFASHPDLAGRLVAGHDFVDNDDTPQDGNGHGTHVSGIVAADSDNNVGVTSVAPAAKIMPIRVLNDKGEGDTTNVAAGIDYAVAHGADVINLSLGSDVPVTGALAGSDDFSAAIDRALDRGVIVVAASGNNGLPTCQQPSGAGRLLCVGAVDRRGNRSFFSSFGSGLGVVAPGGSTLPFADEDVLSTYFNPETSQADYEELAGTSQAAPHVAGVAALLVSLGVRGQDAVRRILATARDAGPTGPDTEYGAGIVDAGAAVHGLKSTASGGSGSGGGGTGGAGGGSGGSGGSGAAGGGASGGSAVSVFTARVQRIAVVRRHGLRVRCTASGRGRCRVSVRYGRRVLAAGSTALVAGRPRTVTVRLTRTGRVVLRRTRHSFRVTVRVALPGAGLQIRRVLLRR